MKKRAPFNPYRANQKMGAKPTADRDGFKHKSMMQAAAYDHYLYPLIQAGEIKRVTKEDQNRVLLGFEKIVTVKGTLLRQRKITWDIDFKALLCRPIKFYIQPPKEDSYYREFKAGTFLYFEPKGHETPDFKRRRRLWKVCGVGPVLIMKGWKVKSGWRFKFTDVLEPGRLPMDFKTVEVKK